MATANHYLLDVLAGILVALIALKTVSWLSTYRKRAIVAA
jgi:membrane-associated phospholipid phosphatase